jgi:TolB-like protein/Tfp pilus assembly protein PilF
MADIFISYAREDRETVRKLAELLQAAGFTCWWDTQLTAGEKYRESTEIELNAASAVLVVWTKHSVGSHWVADEAAAAQEERKLAPISLDGVSPPLGFRQFQVIDFRGWKGGDGEPIPELVSALRTFAPQAPVKVAAHPPAPSSSAVSDRGEPASLAVLPFTSRSGLAEDEVFAEGMVEDIIAALSHGISLRVLASTVTHNLKKAGAHDLASIGIQLNARYLLEGNVRRAANNLRVTTQLVEAATGAVLSATSFDRPLSELAALQEELVLEVASTLDSKIQILEVQRSLRKPRDLTAWEAVTRSNAAFRQLDASALSRSIEEARQAVTIDPNYAAAHAQLAFALGVFYLMTSPDDDAEIQRVLLLGDRAVQLDPDDPFVVTGAANAMIAVGHPERAMPLLARAVSRWPHNVRVRYSLGWACAVLNRPDECLAHFELAARLLPNGMLQYLAFWWRGNAHVHAGRWVEAEAVIDDAIAANPSHVPTNVLKAVLRRRAGEAIEARTMFTTLRRQGFTLEPTLTTFRRCFVNSPVGEEVLASVIDLWTETDPSK